MASPAISVIMSVYNAAPYLAQAITSILAQTDGDFEFLIINDGSTDTSSAILADFAHQDRRIRVIEQPNHGLVFSLNRLLDEARGIFIARMDADDISHPDRFARQRAFLDAHPDYGVIGSWTADITEDGRPRPMKRMDQPTNHAGFVRAIDAGAPLLCHPSAMLRRSVLARVGGYRAAFRHCEDYDLWLRLANVTCLASLPDRLLQYRYSETQVSARHIVEQRIGAAAARLAYAARARGERDPTDGIQVLPPLSGFDALFGRAGAAQSARALCVPGLLYSEVALTSAGFDLILDHVGDGARTPALWRTVARLSRLGHGRRAAQLALALARPW